MARKCRTRTSVGRRTRFASGATRPASTPACDPGRLLGDALDVDQADPGDTARSALANAGALEISHLGKLRVGRRLSGGDRCANAQYAQLADGAAELVISSCAKDRASRVARRRGVSLPQSGELPQEIAGQTRLLPHQLHMVVPGTLQSLLQRSLADGERSNCRAQMLLGIGERHRAQSRANYRYTVRSDYPDRAATERLTDS